MHYRLPLSVILPTAICEAGHEFLFLWSLVGKGWSNLSLSNSKDYLMLDPLD